MEPEKPFDTAGNDLAVNLPGIFRINQRIDLNAPQHRAAGDRIAELLPKRFRNPAKYLRRANNMLPLLALLGDDRKNIAVHLFRFQGIEFQMYLINQVNHTSIAVINIREAVD